MSIDFDFSEVMALAADLGTVEQKVIPFARKAVERTAFNVKKDWRKGANRSSLGGYAASIDYELKLDTDGEIGAEIGPNLGGQGSFGFVEDGGGGVKSAPQHAGRRAAKNAEADFVKGLEKAGEDALK